MTCLKLKKHVDIATKLAILEIIVIGIWRTPITIKLEEMKEVLVKEVCTQSSRGIGS